jgi:preprotein translocase subunit SecB
MTEQNVIENENQPKLSLYRIYLKNNSFETFSVSVASLQNPFQTAIEMQVFSNVYEQVERTHQAVLGLKIEAKHKGDLVWRLQLEVAGFYTLEGFSEEQQKDILHGYCMNQLYSHAAVIATQMVTQGGFVPVYLQPMDFHKVYKERKKEMLSNSKDPVSSETLGDRLNAVRETNFSETLLN